MKIDFIRVPLFYGCDRKGAEKGPEKLFSNNVMGLFEEKGNQVSDAGIIPVMKVPESDKYKAHPKMKYLDAVIDANEKLAKRVSETIKKGHVPFNLGGDHSLGLGSLAGVSEALGKKTAVIWIDAHADINTVESSPSGNIHGMPLGASIGEGDESLINLYNKGIKIDPENVFLIGLRSVDDGEVEIIDKDCLNAWYMEEIRDKGIDRVCKEVLEILSKKEIDHIHISFDIDSIDSTLVPGTGTPVPNGMMPEESKKLLKALFSTGKISSVDFVEYNPDRDKDNITDRTCMEMLTAFADEMAR